MSGRVIHIDTDEHQKVQALLPWYVCVNLDADEYVRVEAHIGECPRCQADLAWERKLHAAHTNIDVQGDVDQGFALMRERIADAAAPQRRRGLVARLMDRWREGPAWMRWAVVGQCLAVAALSGLLLRPPSAEPRFRALGRPAAAPDAAGSGNLIVRFRSETTEQEMRRALRDSEARLVDGPTATDAYLLAVTPGHEMAAVARLRQESAVLIVESLDGRVAP